jgi:hypothetical protein
VPIVHYDGTPITARFIANAIGDHQDHLKVTPLPQGRVMTYIAKPKFHHPGLPRTSSATHRDYEGQDLDLCAPAAATIDHRLHHRRPAMLSIEPHRVARISGIGCSSEDAGLFPRQFARLQLGAGACRRS